MSLQNSVRVRGVEGTLHLMLLRFFNSGRIPEHILTRNFDLKRFDREHSVDTAGLIELDQLDFESPVKAHGTRYGGFPAWRLRDLFAQIPADFSRYSFIDLGSGKGAALFCAAEYPFHRIIGVEFSPELHEATLRNMSTYRSRAQKCRDIVSVCGDAGDYVFPEGPWVLFFNTPFGLPVWERVAANLALARRGQGTSYLIYSNYGWKLETAEFVHKLSFLRMVHEDDTSRIYEFVS